MDEIIIKKFYESVIKTDGCWSWNGLLDKAGLPIIKFTINYLDHEYSARRVSLQLAGIELNKSHVLSICGNKTCVHPMHLVHGDESRFWSKVDKTDNCWIWVAGKDKNGYGKFKISLNGEKKDIRAHIYSYELHYGNILDDSLNVCHKCDNPSCVRPEHLFLGTIQENNKDCVEKNRHAKGERIHLSKLTETEVIEIRELIATHTMKQLSNLYGVSTNQIRSIITGKTWKHLIKQP